MLFYAHQEEAVGWLRQTPRALLGDTPGLGKTRTVLGALTGVERALVICPAIVRGHWRAEHALLRAADLGPEEIVVESYDQITRGGARLMSDFASWPALVVDESHYLKNHAAKRTKLIAGKDGYIRRIPRVILASGTPMPRNPAELYPQIAFLRPDVLQEHGLTTRSAWENKFCVFQLSHAHGRTFRKVVAAKNTPLLADILEGIMMRRTLADVGLDVPGVWWQSVRLESQTRLDLPDVDVDELARIANEPHIATMRRQLGEAKAPLVVAMLQGELEGSEEKVVVFAHHRSVLHELRSGLEAFGVEYVDGDTSQFARELAIHNFQTLPERRVFLGQTIACQTGITLTAASRVVLVEPDWVGTVNHQAAHRVARIGQTAGHCVAQLVMLGGTVDEAIVAQNQREAQMVGTILGESA